MAKLRIYELAKEMDVENKIVLELCAELGISGKTSHSNAITDDEADRIRKHVLRSSVGQKESVTRTETDEGQVLTVRRKGNVIRRRKADAAEPTSESGPVTEPVIEEEVQLIEVAENFEEEVLEPTVATAVAEPELEPSEEVIEVAETAEVVEEPVEVKAEEATVDLDDIRKRHDVRAPRVLGKIELKEEVEKEKPEENASLRKSRKKGVTTPAPVEEDSDKFKKKRRKKQVLRRDDLIDYGGDRDGWRNKKDKKKRRSSDGDGGSVSAPKKASKLVVKIDGEISVGEIAKMMSVKSGEVIKQLMSLGTMANVNQVIDFETATIIGEQFGYKTQQIGLDEDALVSGLMKDDEEEDLETRPAVVTVMGHVDHGKTSLLDALRQTDVTAREAGGITQHIGAYQVTLESGQKITFLDTPGHEAFTAMRSRGAEVTDMVVLVVAADDGVMPQTIEAINHAKAAEVPILVAINKMDKEGANPERIKTQLSEHGLVGEDWGGDIIMVPLSAQTKDGISDLVEMLLLQAEVMDLRSNPDKHAVGTVIESRVDKGRGPVATVLVQNGTLEVGHTFISGATSGKVRALISDAGERVKTAGPSVPVEVLGFSDSAVAGDDFFAMESESEAKSYAEMRADRRRSKSLRKKSAASSMPLTMESLAEMNLEQDRKEITIIVKADVQGSVEAVVGAFERLSTPAVAVTVVHSGVGAITENDINLAAAGESLVVGFNVRADNRASTLIEAQNIETLYSRVIYELVEAIEKRILGSMDPEFQEKTLGRVEVRDTFRVPKLGVVAGSYVLDGIVQRNSQVRLLRDNRVVYEGKLASLRRFKEDVKEVSTGYECGIGIEGYSDIKNGDIIEVFKVEEVRL